MKETVKDTGKGECCNGGSCSLPEDESKRDFMVYAAAGVTAVGACSVAWPLVDSMNPSKDVLAQASVEVDVSGLKEGEEKKIMWRGKPVFIRHRTAKDIEQARTSDNEELRDPQKDEERVKKGKEQWLVTVGVCTHLGCVPQANRGDYGAWFCPCHGSHYDTSGRVRKGPAPKNLAVPPYEFLNDTTIKIG